MYTGKAQPRLRAGSGDHTPNWRSLLTGFSLFVFPPFVRSRDRSMKEVMSVKLLDLSALLVAVTAALAFLNARFLRLPASIGVTVGGLLVSLGLLGLVALEVPFAVQGADLVRGIAFERLSFRGCCRSCCSPGRSA